MSTLLNLIRGVHHNIDCHRNVPQDQTKSGHFLDAIHQRRHDDQKIQIAVRIEVTPGVGAKENNLLCSGSLYEAMHSPFDKDIDVRLSRSVDVAGHSRCVPNLFRYDGYAPQYRGISITRVASSGGGRLLPGHD